jgi:hypothetical protein
MKAKLYNIHATLLSETALFTLPVCRIFYNFANLKNALFGKVRSLGSVATNKIATNRNQTRRFLF